MKVPAAPVQCIQAHWSEVAALWSVWPPTCTFSPVTARGHGSGWGVGVEYGHVHNSKLMNFQLEEGAGCAVAGLAAFSSSFNTMYPPLQFVLEEWRCEAAGRDASSYPALSTMPSMSTETVLCTQPGKAGAVKCTLARDTR